MKAKAVLPFPTYDAASDSVRLGGNAAIMLTLLLKAKFGERFDPEMLFHTRLAELIAQLHDASGVAKPVPGDHFGPEDLFTIAERVIEQSVSIGWWAMAAEEREAFLQSAAAPWVLSDGQIEAICENIEALLFRHRETVAAADAASARP